MGVWGAGPTDVWAAGAIAQIWHFDGKAWQAVASGIESSEAPRFGITTIWGSGADDIWAGGLALR